MDKSMTSGLASFPLVNASQDGGEILSDGHAFFRERFRALRAKLETQCRENPFKVVAVTSALAGEGKSLISANLAVHLARGGKSKVMLIDVDLRKPSIAPLLKISPSPGLTEFLEGQVSARDIISASRPGGVYVVPGGKIDNNPDLLKENRLDLFLKEARLQFDYVILDTPPVLPVSDTLSIKGLVDGMILVYRAGVTPHPLLSQALDELGGGRMLGVVINGTRFEHRIYNSYYRYHYGGAQSTGGR